MMKKRLLLLTLALLLSVVGWATTEIDGIYYNLNESSKTAEVTSGTNQYTGSVTIPSSVPYDGVKYSVTSIGDYAFSWCSGLTSIDIPSSVTTIGSRAFYYCSNLKAFTVNSANDYYKAVSGVLFNKKGTELICYPEGETADSYSIPNGVTSIGDYAFHSCRGLTSIDIPNSVTTIGSRAFDYCI